MLIKRILDWRIWLLAAMAVLVRSLFYYFFLHNNPLLLSFDSGHYHQMAQHFATLGHFAPTDFYRLPGYPLLLGWWYQCFGQWPQGILYLQIFLSGFFVPIIYLLTLRVTSNVRIAWLTCLATVFSVGTAIYAGLLMTEVLFTLFFLLLLYQLVELFDQPTWYGVLASGLLLGCCNLIRPLPGIPLIIVVLMMLFVRQPIRNGVLLVSGWLAVIAIWLVRNWLITGLWFLHILSGPHLLNHGAVRVYAMQYAVTCDQAREILCQQIPATNNSVLSAHAQEKIAAAMLLRYWPETIKLIVMNCFKTLFGLYSSELLVIDSGGVLPAYESSYNLLGRVKKFLLPEVHKKSIVGVVYVEIMLHLLMWLGILGFMVQCLRKRFINPKILFLGGIVVALVVATGICGYARFRLPIEPILIMVTMLFYAMFVGADRSRE